VLNRERGGRRGGEEKGANWPLANCRRQINASAFIFVTNANNSNTNNDNNNNNSNERTTTI